MSSERFTSGEADTGALEFWAGGSRLTAVLFTNQPGVVQAVTCTPLHVATPAWLSPGCKIDFVKPPVKSPKALRA